MSTTTERVARIAERADYPGEAAEKIAAELGVSFGEALALVKASGAREGHAVMTEREIGRQEGWDLALQWLRERASSHAGRWMTMEPKEAIEATVEEMETLSVNG